VIFSAKEITNSKQALLQAKNIYLKNFGPSVHYDDARRSYRLNVLILLFFIAMFFLFLLILIKSI
jgi:hypothetical protein